MGVAQHIILEKVHQMTASSSLRRHAAYPSKALHLARWPYGHRAVFAFQGTKMRSHCFLRLRALYDAEGGIT